MLLFFLKEAVVHINKSYIEVKLTSHTNVTKIQRLVALERKIVLYGSE